MSALLGPGLPVSSQAHRDQRGEDVHPAGPRGLRPLGTPCRPGSFSEGFEEAARWQAQCPSKPRLGSPQGGVSVSLPKERGSPPAFRSAGWAERSPLS